MLSCSLQRICPVKSAVTEEQMPEVGIEQNLQEDLMVLEFAY